VGDLPLDLQAKLLRFLEDGGFHRVGQSGVTHVDTRIIAATNRNLTDEVRKGNLRDDFFYRIHIIPVQLPSLRSRREDIPLLIQHFLQSLSDADTLPVMPEHAIQSMMQRDWPGNIRELQNAVHQFITLNTVEPVEISSPLSGRMPDTEHPPLDATLSLKGAMAHYEKQYLRQTLDTHQWHRARAATLLGIDRRTLFRKMKEHGL